MSSKQRAAAYCRNGMFDLDELLRQADLDAAPPWDGAPLGYHEQYTPPEALDAAFERWQLEHGTFGCIPMSHMWHRAETNPLHAADALEVASPGLARTTIRHELHTFVADTRCDPTWHGTRAHQHRPGELPGDLMAQAICPACGWHHIHESETLTIQAWHDHALPGWRDLPIVPARVRETRGEKKAAARLHAWVAEHYPTGWQQPGYPILTERAPHATRAVPRSSPWGGYDLSAP